MATREKIIKGYVEFELLQGRPPHSVFELAKKLKIEEATFYTHFGSLPLVRQAVLTHLINHTLERLDADENYAEYGSREKVLALFFTLFEEMLSQRSYLQSKYGSIQEITRSHEDWKAFYRQLDARMQQILQEAKANQEVQDRPYIGEHYSKAFHFAFAYLFRVWLKDDSEGFSTTDAAVEKTVHLAFDMLGTSPLDSLIDFGKFALKTKVF